MSFISLIEWDRLQAPAAGRLLAQPGIVRIRGSNIDLKSGFAIDRTQRVASSIIQSSRRDLTLQMFEDRRHRGERRRKTLPAAVPAGGCRRAAGERRHLLRQYHPQPWWLQANYVEEVQPPLLGINKLRKPAPPLLPEQEPAKERSQ